jgi:NarL family two-component system response regulator LiaR
VQNNKNIRVIIADDHTITRDGIKTLLSIYKDFNLIGEATNGREAISLCKKLNPDVVLMDLDMPVMDGVSAIRSIIENNPDTKIVALTSFGDKKLVGDAIKAGATSYIIKNVSPEKIVEAIRDAFNGKVSLSPEATRAIIEAIKEPGSRIPSLTKQELKILELIVEGKSNKEIAGELYISDHTVKFHISNIFSKLGASTRAEAAVIATQQHLLPK